MMLNSLKLTVSCKFFPVGKEIWFLQKTAGLRGRVSNYRILLWRERDGNLHTLYSHVPANTPTFWKSTAPRLTSDAVNISERPCHEQELPREHRRDQPPSVGPRGNPSSPPQLLQRRSPGTPSYRVENNSFKVTKAAWTLPLKWHHETAD